MSSLWGDAHREYRVRLLARKYRQRPGFIHRGLEACDRAGLSSRYFVDCYLQRRDIPRDDDFTRHYLALLQEEQQRNL